MLTIWTRRITAAEASALPPDTPLLAPGKPEDAKKLLAAKFKHPLVHTTLSGPPRSRQEEKWYRGLVGVVAEGIGLEPNTLHFDLKYHAGKILEIVASPVLGPQVVLKSSTQMDDEEFHTFVVLATEILFQRYLPGARRKDVFKEVERRVGHGP
jgi:hypothetical protein